MKYKIISLALIVFAMIGCEKDEVTPPISPDNYPVATFTTDFTGTEINEGDTIKYTITLDKPLTSATYFTARFDTLTVKGTADEDDITVASVTIPAYETEGQLEIVVNADFLAEEDGETLKLEVGSFILGQRYLLNPSTKNPKLALTIKTAVSEINFAWSPTDVDGDANDMDIVIVDAGITSVYDGWHGATGSNPEMTALSIDVPDGIYYVEVNPYEIYSEKMDYTFTIGSPGKGIETFTGVFDMTALATYETGGVGYRVLKIEKAGSVFTYTNLL